MYSRYTIAQKYFLYYIRSANGKGHGIHSPFVYDFVRNVLLGQDANPLEEMIEDIRAGLQKDRRVIEIDDFGAGSGIQKGRFRRLQEITKTSSKSRKLGKLLSRLAGYYDSHTIIELGTSLGFSTAYLASAREKSICYTIEGSEVLSKLARENFEKLGLKNIRVQTGPFDKILPEILTDPAVKESPLDFAFIDGNHRFIPTMHYFDLIKQRISKNGLIVFDDIHWSAEMERAWNKIKKDPSVRLSIDLFFLGIVFFREEFKVKQEFEIRF